MARKSKGHDDRKPATYEVGFGKPPAHSRFKPGQSGNPKGRTQGAKCVRTIAKEAFDKKISLREGDKQLTMSKREALIISTINRGLQKGGKDADVAFKLMAQSDSEAAAAATVDAALTSDEAAVLAGYEARLRAKFEAEMAARSLSPPHDPGDEPKTEGES